MFAFLAAVSMFILTACGNSPSAVTEDFFSALADLDFEEAKELSTGDLRKSMLDSEEKMAKLSDEEQEAFKKIMEKRFKIDKLKDLEVISEDIDGDKATVKVKCDGEEGSITLKKVDGDWKVESFR